MAFTAYENKNFRKERLARISVANEICEEYAAQGLVLTLRQLYYQHVARDLIRNEQREYDKLGELCSDARMAGLMDWDHLIDRTRNLQTQRTWETPQKAMQDMAERYLRDLWAPQKRRVEVWIEKDAAIGVVEGVCNSNSIPFFSSRGYTSMSEMHKAAQRLRWHIEQGNQVLLLHIGDHDPSGLDMSRDIEKRLRHFMTVDWRGLHADAMFARTRRELNASMRSEMREKGSPIEDWQQPFEFKRIALNYDQVQQYSPPNNPVKQSDARWRRYAEETGLRHSWELDALEPTVLQDLILNEVNAIRDDEQWGLDEHQMETERNVMTGVSNWWPEVSRFIENRGKADG